MKHFRRVNKTINLFQNFKFNIQDYETLKLLLHKRMNKLTKKY